MPDWMVTRLRRAFNDKDVRSIAMLNRVFRKYIKNMEVGGG